jgi:hypothetical protein
MVLGSSLIGMGGNSTMAGKPGCHQPGCRSGRNERRGGMTENAREESRPNIMSELRRPGNGLEDARLRGWAINGKSTRRPLVTTDAR